MGGGGGWRAAVGRPRIDEYRGLLRDVGDADAAHIILEKAIVESSAVQGMNMTVALTAYNTGAGCVGCDGGSSGGGARV